MVLFLSLFLVCACGSPRECAPPLPLHQRRRHPRPGRPAPLERLQRDPVCPPECSCSPQGRYRYQSRRKSLVCQRTKSVPLRPLISLFIPLLAWLSWLNAAILIGTFSVALYNASRDPVARGFAYVYAALSIGVLVPLSVSSVPKPYSPRHLSDIWLLPLPVPHHHDPQTRSWPLWSVLVPTPFSLALSPSQMPLLVPSSLAPCCLSQFWPTLSFVVCTTPAVYSHSNYSSDHSVRDLSVSIFLS